MIDKSKRYQIAKQAALATLGAGGNYVDDRTVIILAAIDEALALPVTEDRREVDRLLEQLAMHHVYITHGFCPVCHLQVPDDAMRSAQIKGEG